MKLIFRVDSSRLIGAGHVMRCITLAKFFQKMNHTIIFATRVYEGSLITEIKNAGFEIVVLSDFSKEQLREPNVDSWLPVSEEQDAIDFLNAGISCDVVVVDHYSLGDSWEKKVKQHLGCFLVVIDDLKRKHYCDLLIDQTLNRREIEYIPQMQISSQILTGSMYAILKPEFYRYRQLRIKKKTMESDENSVLVFMGGVDNSNITMDVLQEILKIDNLNLSVTVIMNPLSRFYSHVEQFIKNNSVNFKLITFTENIHELMVNHKIAIGAPGSSTWERAALGLPSLIIPIAENQLEIAKVIESSCSAIVVQRDCLQADFKMSFLKLLNNIEIYRKNSFKLCDALGVFRVGYQILNLKGNSIFYRCRVADENDINLTYEWQVLPQTRRYALNQNIPSYKSHCSWMVEKLKSNIDYFYIIEIILDGVIKSAGVVRLDLDDKTQEYTISIYIAPQFYKMGIASAALKYIDIVHPQIVINATVLNENFASQQLFSKMGYIKTSDILFQRKPIQNEEEI